MIPRRRLIGWIITRNSMYWDFESKIFRGKCSKDCIAESSNKWECDMIARNLKAKVLSVWVNENE